MTILPTIISGIFSIILWWHFRKSFKRHFIDIFYLDYKNIYWFDFLIIFSTSFRFLIRAEIKAPWFNSLVTSSYVLLGFLGIFILWLILLDCISFYEFLKNKLHTNRGNFSTQPINEITTNENIINRRSFLKRNLTFAPLLGGATITGIGYYNSFDPKIEQVFISLKPEHIGLKGLKIVQLSDIHLGPTLKADFAELLVERVNKLSADLVVITGDMIDGTVASIGDDILPFKKFNSKYGTYFITGNHEYYWHANQWREYVQSLGIKVLNNENIKISFNNHDFYLAGVADVYSKRLEPDDPCDLEKAKKSIPAGAYSILLSHQPKTCYEASKLGYDLQLSGHTHGGQGFPWNMIVYLVQPYVKGLHTIDNMQLYVSKGTGFWGPPNRFMVDSEITEIIFT